MAATTTVISGTMNAGDHCVITESSYGGTNRICREQFIPLGMEFDFVDFRDLEAVKSAIKPNTREPISANLHPIQLCVSAMSRPLVKLQKKKA